MLARHNKPTVGGRDLGLPVSPNIYSCIGTVHNLLPCSQGYAEIGDEEFGVDSPLVSAEP